MVVSIKSTLILFSHQSLFKNSILTYISTLKRVLLSYNSLFYLLGLKVNLRFFILYYLRISSIRYSIPTRKTMKLYSAKLSKLGR